LSVIIIIIAACGFCNYNVKMIVVIMMIILVMFLYSMYIEQINCVLLFRQRRQYQQNISHQIS